MTQENHRVHKAARCFFLRGLPGLGVLFGLLLFCLGVGQALAAGTPAAAPLSAADEDQLLQISISRAKEQLALGNPADALKILESAYASVPTPALLWPIAELHQQLEQPLEGLAVLDKYIAQVPPAKMPRGQQMPQVEHLQELMRSQLGRITLTFVEEKATLLLDGLELTPAAIAHPLEVDPGRHRIESRLGAKQLSREVRVQPGQELRLEMRHTELLPCDESLLSGVAPSSRHRRTVRTAAWVLGGIGVASIITGSVLWGLSAAGSCSQPSPSPSLCTPGPDLETPGIGLFSAGLGLGSAALVFGLLERK